MKPNLTLRDLKRLSAYLDGNLKPSEKADLEARLKTDLELKSAFKDLRQTQHVLRKLPQRRIPRSFTLTPEMVGQKPPMPRSYSVFRFASAMAAVLFLFSFVANAPLSMSSPAPALYAVAEDAAEPELAMEAAPEAEPMEEALEEPAEEPAGDSQPAPEVPPLEEPAVEVPALQATPTAPTEGMDKTTPDNSPRAQATAAPSTKSGVQVTIPTPSAQEAPPAELPQAGPSRSIPVSTYIQIFLGGAAIISGLLALILRSKEIRKWRAKAR